MTVPSPTLLPAAGLGRVAQGQFLTPVVTGGLGAQRVPVTAGLDRVPIADLAARLRPATLRDLLRVVDPAILGVADVWEPMLQANVEEGVRVANMGGSVDLADLVSAIRIANRIGDRKADPRYPDAPASPWGDRHG